MPALNISIASPCHENWNNMSPTQRGVHCLACNKEVVDFTTWTDRDLVNYLSTSSNVCGRLRSDQLRIYGPVERKDKRRWWIALTFIMSIVLSNSVAQSDRKTQTEQVDDTRLDELKGWSAKRSASKDIGSEINKVPERDVTRLLTGRLGGVCMTTVTVIHEQEVRTWYLSIFDMLWK